MCVFIHSFIHLRHSDSCNTEWAFFICSTVYLFHVKLGMAFLPPKQHLSIERTIQVNKQQISNLNYLIYQIYHWDLTHVTLRQGFTWQHMRGWNLSKLRNFVKITDINDDVLFLLQTSFNVLNWDFHNPWRSGSTCHTTAVVVSVTNGRYSNVIASICWNTQAINIAVKTAQQCMAACSQALMLHLVGSSP